MFSQWITIHCVLLLVVLIATNYESAQGVIIAGSIALESLVKLQAVSIK